MNFLTKMFSLLSLSFSLGVSAQGIDSAYASYNNDSLRVFVEGRVMNYDFDAIKRIIDNTKADSVFIDIFFQPCSPLQTFAPYDTSFSIQGPFSQGINHIRLYGILQKDTVGSCYGFKGSDEIIDTAFLVFNVPLSTTETVFADQIEVYPNPTSDLLFIEGKTIIEKIVVINPAGIVLKEVQLSGGIIDISELPTGFYILKLEIDGQVQTTKINKL